MPTPASFRSRSVLGLICAAVVAASAARAEDAKPYDDKLARLSEILGAVHYLRELCGANDGQLWRERMKELMDARAPRRCAERASPAASIRAI